MQDLSDTDEEMDVIMHVDQIMKDLINNPHQPSHEKIYTLFKKLDKINDIVDMQSEVMSIYT